MFSLTNNLVTDATSAKQLMVPADAVVTMTDKLHDVVFGRHIDIIPAIEVSLQPPHAALIHTDIPLIGVDEAESGIHGLHCQLEPIVLARVG